MRFIFVLFWLTVLLLGWLKFNSRTPLPFILEVGNMGDNDRVCERGGGGGGGETGGGDEDGEI
jgi:hypothetical protein